MVRYRKKLVSLPIRLRNQKWDTYTAFWHATVASSPARVRLWPSTGAGRGQYAGSALLRNEAVHTVLLGHVPTAVWSFPRKARDLVASRWVRWRAAQSENQLDTGRFAMKGMASTRP